jgi:endo-1,4-beta-xylanase
MNTPKILLATLFLTVGLSLSLSACTPSSAITTVTPKPDPDPVKPDPVIPIVEDATLPAGGSNVLGADTFAAFRFNSSDAVKIETIPSSNPKFSQAWRVTGLKPLEQPYLSQLSADNALPIAKDDALVVQFWAKSTTSGSAGSAGTGAKSEFVLEWNSDPYDKSTLVDLKFTPTWTLYSVPFSAHRDFPVGKASAHFRLGYVNQGFELGGVVLKNYGKTLPVTSLPFAGFSYPGRESNAAWRSAAHARIEQIRKADLTIKVQDSSGKPLPNATVTLEMQRHAFPFGSAIDANTLLGNLADSSQYQKTALELFNRVVLENDLKWPTWECCTRNKALEALQFFKAKNVTVRGHNLLWPCDADYCLPNDVVGMLNNPVALRSRIDQHLQDILGATQGQVVEWDVINEPSANKRL